ncbi:hypothetical protein SK128_028298, partial [Halocaridina rubra]
TAREGALLLMAPVPTVTVRVTGPGPLDDQPMLCNAAIVTRLATTTDVARKRTRVRTVLQAPVRLPHLPVRNTATVVMYDASLHAMPSRWCMSYHLLRKPTGSFRSLTSNSSPFYLTITPRGLS